MFAIEPLIDNGGKRYGARLREVGASVGDFGILPEIGMLWAPTLTADGVVARIEYTRSPLSNITLGRATWEPWGVGDIDGTLAAVTASEFLSEAACKEVTGFRVVVVSGAGTYDVYLFGALGADRAGGFITPEGGRCELKTWDATSAGPTVAGEIVVFNDPGEVALATAGANLPYSLGVVYDSDCPPGGIAPIVVSGEADVLLVDTVASTLDDLASLSTTVDGRSEPVAPPVAATWSEYTNWIGQYKEVVVGGVNQRARVKLRF